MPEYRLSEKQAIDRLIRNILDTWASPIHIVKVESVTSRGFPDLSMCLNGVEAWVEAKLITHGRVLLRPEQYAWGHRRARANGRVFILAIEPKTWNVIGWRFPHIEVEPYGKYVAVKNAWSFNGHLDNNVDEIISFLFT